MDEELAGPATGTTLDESNAINNDSNSLEAGEIVDDTPPVVGPPEEENPVGGVSGSGDLEEAGEKTPPAVTNSSSEKSGSSTKPVLGKEKAKQRLKAIGIQKRIQMESKKSRPEKLSRKKSRENNSGGSGQKKDKPPTPHEKAKLTKEEIEKLKEKQDCALPCLYYDAAMIHHIRADIPEKKTPSTGSSKAGPCLTASLEAIKNYEDQDEPPEGSSESVKNDLKLPPQGNETMSGNEHHGQHHHHRDPEPLGETIRNYNLARRKLYFRGSGDILRHNFSMRGRDKVIRGRINQNFRNIRPFRDFSRRLQRELPRLPSILKEGGNAYTKTKPVITFSINTNINKALSSISEYKKIRKKSKHKTSTHKIKPKKKSRSKSVRDGSKKRSISSVKSRKKKKSNSKKDKNDKKDRNKKIKNKKNHPNKICGALSFHLNEFLPEEDVEVFPLSKDNIEPTEDQDEDDAALENKLKCLQEELNKKSPSPDTDDYMANWEEEEDFAAVSVSIDMTPKKSAILIAKVQGQIGGDAVREGTPEGSNTPKIGPLPSGGSTPEKIDQDQFESEMRDGLGTPIYVNPSPPAEMLGVIPGPEEEKPPPVVPPSMRKQPVAAEEEDDDFEVSKSKEMTPKIPSSPLFGMQVIYEQFIQSVSEAGIELSLGSQPAPKKPSDGAEELPQNNAVDEEESSFTPNASPTGGKICENLEDALPKNVSSSPKSGSSTPDSSSDTASSTSSTTTTDTSLESPNGEKTPDQVKECENVENVEKGNLTSILSPEDTQKLRSLHERSRMLKNLQEQSDAMDDEDKQCLLGLEKLIEAEKNLLMRKYDVARDLTEELKLRDPSSPCDSNETPDRMTPPRVSVIKNLTDTTDELEPNKIFDVNREAVKLKFSPKRQKSSSRGAVTQTPMEEDDQDFTEKLLKTTTATPSKDHSEGGERKKRERKFSRSVSRSPESQKSIRKGRSLSISPTRRSREQWMDKQKRSKRQRHYSPTPSNRKRVGGGDSKRGGRSHRWPLSPLIRKRSRSPYGRRFSRSPPFRPPSPKSPPPRGRSTSPQKERNSRLDSDGGGGSSTQSYSWSEDSAGNYYPTNESYYYIPSPVQGGAQKPRPTCEPGEFYHPNYRLYNYDYQTMGLYANSYGNEYVGPEPMSYSRIPVINSTGGNFYYDDFNPADDSHNSQNSEHPETNNNLSNIKQLPIDSGSGSTTDKKHFVVQKGNVLEIVPTSIIPKIEEPDSNSYENDATQSEQSSVVIKSEPEFNQDGDEPLNENGNDKKIEMPIALKVEKNTNEKKRKKRKNQEFVLWEDEIAKRHILSAVLRLNKEDDGTLRGILYNKTISEKAREKKRVIFADGIPPGRSSSTSDEESSPVRLRIPRRLKKRRRRRKGAENKENEATLGIDTPLIGDCFKIDPELDNLPPPPPPPGDPPPHLPQPVLLKPPSPEQFLYFHFDPVVSSMYISNSPTPIPPRLLNRGVQSNVGPQMGPPLPGAPRNSNSINQSNVSVGGGNGPTQPFQMATAKGCFIPRDQGNDPQMYPSTKLGELQHLPGGIMPPLHHPDRRFRPQQQQPFMPPMMMPVAAAGGGEFRPPSPIIPGFSMFNRPILRASSANLNRSDFPVPPPSPQPSQQQQQQILGHPSIPFGPRPPGGVANFNRNIPPPFIGSQQRCESPSMISNFQPIQPIHQNLGNMRSSLGSVQIFAPNSGGVPNFGSPTMGLRPPGVMNSPIGGFSKSGFTPPTSSANVKNIPILLGKSSGIPLPGGQFARSNTPMMGGRGDGFIPNPQPILPPHPGPRSGPFNPTGMPVQMHRPNLGFPRSFGPPPPPCPQQIQQQQQKQQMFMQQQQQQQSQGGAPPQPTVRPMFPSPVGNYQFLRNDGVIPEHQQSPQHPPHPPI